MCIIIICLCIVLYFGSCWFIFMYFCLFCAFFILKSFYVFVFTFVFCILVPSGYFMLFLFMLVHIISNICIFEAEQIRFFCFFGLDEFSDFRPRKYEISAFSALTIILFSLFGLEHMFFLHFGIDNTLFLLFRRQQ